MKNVCSLTGANSATQLNWVWCVPGDASPANMPVCVLVMSSAGPRYLPTSVIAPAEHRKHPGPHAEVHPSTDDIELGEAVFAWARGNEELHVSNPLVRAFLATSNNVPAAMRFLDCSDEACDAAGPPIADEDRYLGRSVLVQPSYSGALVTGWIASWKEPFDIVILDEHQVYRKILASADCLIEDGTISRVEYKSGDMAGLR